MVALLSWSKVLKKDKAGAVLWLNFEIEMGQQDKFR